MSALVEVPMSKTDARLMVLSGFAALAEDDVLELTAGGEKWLREWIAARLAALTLSHGASGDPEVGS